MREQLTSDYGLTDADAMRLMRSFDAGARRQAPSQERPGLGGAAQARLAVLTRTVEDEVIPRLLMVQRPQTVVRAVADTTASRPGENHPGADHVAMLVDRVLSGTQTSVTAYVEAMRDAGTPVETLFLDLIAPTANRLGVMWEEDICDFSEVTLGVLRLGNVMRLLSQAFSGDYAPNRVGPSALLAQMPGEQHGLGLTMVVQFFRRAGWNVREERVPTQDDLVGIVKDQWFGVVGLSVACADRLESLAASVRAIRRHSRNPSIGVLVGGPPFLAHPQLAALVGADATATDGRQAVQQARSLLSLLARTR